MEHAASGACDLNQFGLAERATDWRGNNIVAESIIGQMCRQAHREPRWIVCAACTAGTSATIGRSLAWKLLRPGISVAIPTPILAL